MFITRSGWYLLDEGDHFLHLVGVHLGGGDFGAWSCPPAEPSQPSHLLTSCGWQCRSPSNTSLFWQHLWMATPATPPQPMINTLPYSNSSFLYEMWVPYTLGSLGQGQQHLPQHLAGSGGGHAAGVQHGGQLVDIRRHHVGSAANWMTSSSCGKVTPRRPPAYRCRGRRRGPGSPGRW